MATLFPKIRILIAGGRYIIGQHAIERLDERGLLEWQIIDSAADAILIREHPRRRPNPTVELRHRLADGTEVKVVWSYLKPVNVAKLVTVHFFDA